MADNKKIATDVLDAVGGKANVAYVTHCMTRLRFSLKDRSIVDDKEVKKLDGVLGAQDSGGQFQVIIGQNVSKVYEELCKQGGFEKQEAIDENLDEDADKLTVKKFFGNMLNYMSGSMVPFIPVLLCAGLFKSIGVILGSTMLGIVSDDSDIATLSTIIYNAAFYFLPIYLGYNAAKQLGATPVLGAFMGGILIEPTFASMASEGTSFSVFGIPCTPASYAQTVVPILLSVWVLYYVERFFKKHLPDVLTTIFVPFLAMLITIPVSLCFLAPLGSWIGTAFGAFFEMISSQGGIVYVLSAGLLAALWGPLVLTGMHVTVATMATANFMSYGYDKIILPAVRISLWVGFGTALAAWVKFKNKKDKNVAMGGFISSFVGGVGEPYMYGIKFRYPKTWVVDAISGFIAGAVGAILNVTVYTVGTSSNFLSLIAFLGGPTQNFINGCIAAAVAFVVGFVMTYFFAFTKDELENGPASERA